MDGAACARRRFERRFEKQVCLPGLRWQQRPGTGGQAGHAGCTECGRQSLAGVQHREVMRSSELPSCSPSHIFSAATPAAPRQPLQAETGLREALQLQEGMAAGAQAPGP